MQDLLFFCRTFALADDLPRKSLTGGSSCCVLRYLHHSASSSNNIMQISLRLQLSILYTYITTGNNSNYNISFTTMNCAEFFCKTSRHNLIHQLKSPILINNTFLHYFDKFNKIAFYQRRNYVGNCM